MAGTRQPPDAFRRSGGGQSTRLTTKKCISGQYVFRLMSNTSFLPSQAGGLALISAVRRAQVRAVEQLLEAGAEMHHFDAVSLDEQKDGLTQF